jgi:hypothetical protein
VGEIGAYLLVGFRSEHAESEQAQELFVQIRAFDMSGVRERDPCGSYIFETSSTEQSTLIIVHYRRLSKSLARGRTEEGTFCLVPQASPYALE